MKYLLSILWMVMAIYWFSTDKKEACALAAGMASLWAWENS